MKTFAITLTVLCLVLSGSVVLAAGGNAYPSMNQSFDFGDVRGGYSTYSYDGKSVGMSADISLSSGVVTSVDCYVQPASWYNNNIPGRNYFQVNMYIGGTYNVLPTEMDWLSQSQSATHRGISVSENASIGSYRVPQEWNGEGLPPTPITWSTASADISLSPFTGVFANGNFSEYSWVNPWSGVREDTFSYNIVWTGYTDNAVAAGIFGAIAPTTIPEPATICLLAFGAITMMAKKRRI